MKKTIQIFIVDDHAIFREGLKFVLSQVPGVIICNEASNGNEFLLKLETEQPDIVLMDISMPGMDGIEATEKAIKKFPNLKIIAITSYGDEEYYLKMIKAGAKGFVQKKTSLEELQNAIQNVIKDENYFSTEVMQRIILKIGSGENSTKEDLLHLSQREKEILLLICQGYSNNEIGEKLYISPKTVDKHRTSLLSKTQTRNSAHLVMYALKNNLVEI